MLRHQLTAQARAVRVARRLQARLDARGVAPTVADRLAAATSRADGRPLSPFRPVPADLRAAIAEAFAARHEAAAGAPATAPAPPVPAPPASLAR